MVQDKAAVKQDFLDHGKTPEVVGCVDGTVASIVRPKTLSPSDTESYWGRQRYCAFRQDALVHWSSSRRHVPLFL